MQSDAREPSHADAGPAGSTACTSPPPLPRDNGVGVEQGCDCGFGTAYLVHFGNLA